MKPIYKHVLLAVGYLAVIFLFTKSYYMKTICFEKGKKLEFKNASGSSDFDSRLGTMTRIANRYGSDKSRIIQDLREVVPSEFKLGFGGTHIWCANNNGQRIFIIEGY